MTSAGRIGIRADGSDPTAVERRAALVEAVRRLCHPRCRRFGPDVAEALRHRKPRRGRNWYLDEVRVVISGAVHWLWRAINEHGEVLDV